MDLQLEGLQQQLKTIEDSHGQDLKTQGGKVEGTDVVLETLGSHVHQLMAAHKVQCRSMEEGAAEAQGENSSTL